VKFGLEYFIVCLFLFFATLPKPAKDSMIVSYTRTEVVYQTCCSGIGLISFHENGLPSYIYDSSFKVITQGWKASMSSPLLG
jgi:hypothetical protein